MKYSSSRITMLLIGLASTVSAQAATTIMDAVDFRSVRSVGHPILQALLGDENENRILRPVAKFDLAQIRPNITEQTTVTLSFTIERIVEVTNSLYFDKIDLLSLGSTGNTVVLGDYDAAGSLIGNFSPLSTISVGEVISFDVTNAVLTEAANVSSDYIGFRIQAGDGFLSNGDSTPQFIDFENSASQTAQLSITNVPEPSSSLLTVFGSLALLLQRRRA